MTKNWVTLGDMPVHLTAEGGTYSRNKETKGELYAANAPQTRPLLIFQKANTLRKVRKIMTSKKRENKGYMGRAQRSAIKPSPSSYPRRKKDKKQLGRAKVKKAFEGLRGERKSWRVRKGTWAPK